MKALRAAPRIAFDVTTTAAVDNGAVPSSDDRVPSKARNEALDHVKGCLVLAMVLYHWLNYFVGFDWDGYRYLRFLTPSFIFITGLLVAHVYVEKFACDRSVVRRRLLQRGARLMVLFLALNLADTVVAVQSLSPSQWAGPWPAERIADVLWKGDGGAAFSILLPIAYFLMLVPATLELSRRSSMTLPLMALAGVIATTLMSAVGYENAHLELLSIGLMGQAVGAIGLRRIEPAIAKPAAVAVAYLLYVVAITLWNVPFWLQVIGVCLSVLLLYISASAWPRPGLLEGQLTTLGRYSLFAYIAQIAVLQALSRGLRVEPLPQPVLALTLVLAVGLTVLAVRSMATLRAKSSAVDSLYRAVFA